MICRLCQCSRSLSDKNVEWAEIELSRGKKRSHLFFKIDASLPDRYPLCRNGGYARPAGYVRTDTRSLNFLVMAIISVVAVVWLGFDNVSRKIDQDGTGRAQTGKMIQEDIQNAWTRGRMPK